MNTGRDFPTDGEDPPLTPEQRQLMAYIDDDLSAEERREFEASMTSDPALAAEVVRHQNLIDLTSAMEQVEPTEAETRRFWARFYNRSEWRVGWCLLVVGLVVLGAELIYVLLTLPSDMFSPVAKGSVLCVLLGGAILLWNTFRLRMRTSHFDRYRGVMR